MAKRFGFTLAEVLITLGIIGVVAAMTIPTLIANTNGAKYRSQFKKTLSTLNQAALMSKAQYELDFSGIVSKSCGATLTPESVSLCGMLNGTLAGATLYNAGTSPDLKLVNNNRYGYTGVSGFAAGGGLGPIYALADGSLFGFHEDRKGACTLELGDTINADWISGHPQCHAFIDVNGVAGPNKEVTCADGTAALTPETPCVVPNNATNMTDVFPVIIHDTTVEPASNAAKYVLTSSK